MTRQLAFDLPVRESRARGDFFVSDANALAMARVDAVETWPNGKLVLVGPQGSGKTHLAHVWAEANGALGFELGDLTALDVVKVGSPAFVECEAERLDGPAAEALFHLHNHMQSQDLALLLLAQRPPSQWEIALPDLKSRMEATDVVRIKAPDDDLLAAVLLKQFADRQVQVSPSVINYLVTHMKRSFAEAEWLVEALDRASLAEGRAVTRPLAQAVLDNRPRPAA